MDYQIINSLSPLPLPFKNVTGPSIAVQCHKEKSSEGTKTFC